MRSSTSMRTTAALAASALATLVVAAAAPPASASSPQVLTADAAPAVTALLDLETELAAGVSLDTRIDKDHIVVSATRGDELLLRVTLRHPSAAPDGAEVIGGVALDRAPGPAPEALLADLVARMRVSGATVPWHTPRSATLPDDDGAALERDNPHLAAIDRAIHHVHIGEPDAARARLTALPAGPAALTDHERLRAALAWRLLDDDAAVAAVLEPLGADGPPASAILAGVLRGDVADADAALALATGDVSACDLAVVADLFYDLERYGDARDLARAVRGRDGACARAWEREIRATQALRDHAGAREVLAAASAALPDADRLRAVEADVLRGVGDIPGALAALERLAADDPTRQGRLATLLAVFLDVPPEERGPLRADLEARLSRDADDHVARYLVGVNLHYDNAFERSNEVLAPLEAVYGFEPRLHIYLAMNDFNLGRADAALARLDRAVELPAMDPDVYYCRAEVLRDRDRAQARRELSRYLTASRRSWAASEEKQGRIAELLAALDACIASGVEVCPGPWEHPRLRPDNDDSGAGPEEASAGQGDAEAGAGGPDEGDAAAPGDREAGAGGDAPAVAQPEAAEQGAGPRIKWWLIALGALVAALAAWVVARRRRR